MAAYSAARYVWPSTRLKTSPYLPAWGRRMAAYYSKPVRYPDMFGQRRMTPQAAAPAYLSPDVCLFRSLPPILAGHIWRPRVVLRRRQAADWAFQPAAKSTY